MTRVLPAAVLAALPVLACGRSRKEEPPLLDPVHAVALPQPAVQVAWDAALCPPVDEPEGVASFSDLTFTGTCSFHHRGPAICRARGDDWYAVIHRRLRDGSSADFFVNVEYYTGAARYEKKTELLFMIQDGPSYYRWSNQQATVTLGFGGGLSLKDKNADPDRGTTPTLAVLDAVALPAEPGTVTSGEIAVHGSIGCILKEAARE